MFYTEKEYKDLMKYFILRNGMIIKLIDPDTKNNIGNLIRYELINSKYEAIVLINVSLFDDNENFKKYSLKDLKYFGIKRTIKKECNLSSLEDIVRIEITNDSYEDDIRNFLKNNKLSNENVISFISEKIKNIKSYYRNKNIIAYCI
jgi:hypothetical protein